MNKTLNLLCVQPTLTLAKTIEAIGRAAKAGAPPGIAVVTDQNRKVLGIVTDGNVRRLMLKKIPLDTPVRKVMTREPIAVAKGLSPKEILASIASQTKSKGRMQTGRIDRILVLDGQGRLDDILTHYDLWRNQDVAGRSVAVIGLGYVGLTLAAVLADSGFEVTGVDINAAIVRRLAKLQPTFYERGIWAILRHARGKRFRVTTTAQFSGADVYILCIGTPLDAKGNPKLSDLESAVRFIAGKLKRGDLVVVRSTVPLGTCRNVIKPLLESTTGLEAGNEFYLVMAPERTAEGKAVEELRTLPQIIGGVNEASTELAAKLFNTITKTIVQVQSLEAAEMVKLINNAYRDLTFSFANEAALLAKRLGLDAVGLIRAANEGYPRGHVPMPSPGVGGVCLKKDPHIYVQAGKTVGLPSRLVSTGRSINESIPPLIADEIIGFLNKNDKPPRKSKIFLLGFAFKGNPPTSDTRDSCTLDVLNRLKAAGANVVGYDPIVSGQQIARWGAAPATPEQGFRRADAAVIMNNNPAYQDLDIYRLLQSMRRPALFYDGWYLFLKEEIERVPGITYAGWR
ncbi:MAG: nucleotide sugar dehydrogenase [Elusimicrobia bacterium]|nr:nucleotide sugar dehydrogenase [Elusimicrobiota bacterium]